MAAKVDSHVAHFEASGRSTRSRRSFDNYDIVTGACGTKGGSDTGRTGSKNGEVVHAF